MDSELIVLSSDDEDDVVAASPPAKLHKRIKVLDADNDVTVIEKVSWLESRAIEKSSLVFSSPTECKRLHDDDCCILNYDPDNNVHVPDFKANDADDLVVVGERGPVACRDFPHARHLCVKFPFTTTSHEKYCEQCHCYVCDVVAPCLLWGQGKQSSDHCHAFDKDEKWKKMRSHARSVTTKLSAPSPAPIRRGQIIQPQLRTYTQPPLRVTLTTGIKSSKSHANMNANVSSVNQYWSSLPGNWVPYMPSTMLANGSYGNRASVGGTNMPCVGNSNVVPPANNRRRSFSEHNSAVSNNAPTAQQMSYQPPLNPVPVHGSIRVTQTCTPREGAMHNSPTLQAETRFINTPGQQYQEQGVVAPALAPCNYVEGLSTQRIPGRPHALTLSKIGKDLATLQAYLMEGLTGQSQGQSTAHGMSTVEAGCMQTTVCSSGDSVSKGPSDMSLNRDSERLYNPFEPSEMPLCNNVEVGIMPHQTANTQASVQISKNNESMLEPVSVNKDIPENPICFGGGTDTTSSLDQVLADFDDDFWMLLEPTFSGF